MCWRVAYAVEAMRRVKTELRWRFSTTDRFLYSMFLLTRFVLCSIFFFFSSKIKLQIILYYLLIHIKLEQAQDILKVAVEKLPKSAENMESNAYTEKNLLESLNGGRFDFPVLYLSILVYFFERFLVINCFFPFNLYRFAHIKEKFAAEVSGETQGKVRIILNFSLFYFG